MTDFDFMRNQLEELRLRHTRSCFVVRTTPDDCASGKANLRRYLPEDISALRKNCQSAYTRLTDTERALLLDELDRFAERCREDQRTLVP